MAKGKYRHLHDYGGTLFVGCIIIGLGIGIIIGEAGAGVLIGLGIGFIVMGLSKMISGLISKQIDKEEEPEERK